MHAKVELLQLINERSSGLGFVELLTPKVPPVWERPVGDVQKIYISPFYTSGTMRTQTRTKFLSLWISQAKRKKFSKERETGLWLSNKLYMLNLQRVNSLIFYSKLVSIFFNFDVQTILAFVIVSHYIYCSLFIIIIYFISTDL